MSKLPLNKSLAAVALAVAAAMPAQAQRTEPADPLGSPTTGLSASNLNSLSNLDLSKLSNLRMSNTGVRETIIPVNYVTKDIALAVTPNGYVVYKDKDNKYAAVTHCKTVVSDVIASGNTILRDLKDLYPLVSKFSKEGEAYANQKAYLDDVEKGVAAAFDTLVDCASYARGTKFSETRPALAKFQTVIDYVQLEKAKLSPKP